MSRRAMITGFGVLAPGAIGAEADWGLLSEGRTATRAITCFDASPYRSRIAGEVDFDASAGGLTPAQLRGLDRAAQFALVAGREAVAGSGLDLDAADPTRVGVAIGCAVGCATSIEREYAAGRLQNPGAQQRRPARAARAAASLHDTAPLHDYVNPSSIAAELARMVGAQGPVTLVSTGCTSGIDAVAYAARLVEEGSADVVLSGGTEAPLAPITAVCFDVLRATSTRNDDPARACRPFDRARDGLVLAEGCAILVVEEYEHAKARGAGPQAEIVGYGSRCAAHRLAGLETEELQMAAAIGVALERARLRPAQIDYVNAHGSGTVHNDLQEAAALKRALGRAAARIPVSGFKAATGHALGAAGALQIAGCLPAMREGLIPPTANLREPDPECDLDYTPGVARQARVDTVLALGAGFGGLQSAMVLRRADGGGR